MYIKYDIQDTTTFDHAHYREVTSELASLISGISHIQSDYKSAILQRVLTMYLMYNFKSNF